MRLNWVDFAILGLLSLGFISGYRKDIIRGILNLIIAAVLIKFILFCLDSVTLPRSLASDLRESYLADKFLHPLASVKAIERREYEFK